MFKRQENGARRHTCLLPSRTSRCGGRQVLAVQRQRHAGWGQGRQGTCWATGCCWGRPQGRPKELKGLPELCSFCGKERPRSRAWPGGTREQSASRGMQGLEEQGTRTRPRPAPQPGTLVMGPSCAPKAAEQHVWPPRFGCQCHPSHLGTKSV